MIEFFSDNKIFFKTTTIQNGKHNKLREKIALLKNLIKVSPLVAQTDQGVAIL